MSLFSHIILEIKLFLDRGFVIFIIIQYLYPRNLVIMELKKPKNIPRSEFKYIKVVIFNNLF